MSPSQKSNEFIKSKFAEYYNKHAILKAPTNIKNREFGFFTFGKKSMIRHLSFKSEEELKTFLEKTVPSDAFSSSAYYEHPTAKMNEKAWFGADLIFDIDADHIPTSCDKAHDEWTCRDCGHQHKGQTLEKCPKCKGQKLDVKSWPCEVCLNSARIETSKLIDMLIQDFGFRKEEMHVFFSGHRGYHVHVENEAFRGVDTLGRKEVVDYIGGLGLDLTLHGFDNKRTESKHVHYGGLDNFGWRGRILKCIDDSVCDAKRKDCRTADLKDTGASSAKREEKMHRKPRSKRSTSSEPIPSKKKIERCKDYASTKIDTVVTTDVHRLIRLPGSLHSKTGLRKVEFPLSNLKEFDPFKSAVPLMKGTVRVSVFNSPKFRLCEETFGPYKSEEVDLSVAAAVLLICRGRAEVVE